MKCNVLMKNYAKYSDIYAINPIFCKKIIGEIFSLNFAKIGCRRN